MRKTATLFKMVEGFALSFSRDIDELDAITNPQLAEDHGFYRLSQKNCEIIASGYDLDEIAEDYVYLLADDDGKTNARHDFIQGFLKAVEILENKEFTEWDMLNCWNTGVNSKSTSWVEFMMSLQKNKWDVEVEMRSKNMDELRESGEGFLNNPNLCVPALDENGCLICHIKQKN